MKLRLNNQCMPVNNGVVKSKPRSANGKQRIGCGLLLMAEENKHIALIGNLADARIRQLRLIRQKRLHRRIYSVMLIHRRWN